MTQPSPDRQPAPGEGVVVRLAELIALRQTAVRSPPPLASRSLPGGATPQRLGINSQGLAYLGSRPHQNGDDRRAVDWRQSARRGRLYTKQFAEEHERPIQFLVDMGASMRFGTRVAFKSVVAARIAGHLAWRFAAAGERVGGLAWTGRARPELDARHEKHGLLPLLKLFADASAEAPATAPGLDWPLHRLAQKPGLAATVVISDFAGLSAEAEGSLRICARRNHLILIHVHDPFEQNPPPGIYRLNDGRDSVTLDLHAGPTRDAFVARFAACSERLRHLAQAVRADYLPIATNADLPATLQGAWRRFPGQGRARARD
ncbi:DUF58 domain-containing protein [Dechloromonas sp. A34]|uniref:DUF58 domain-containing protein n=1 Tax=Dechloromonas sp. A34 TaxID=447588 RepID=UPI0022494414|nr:DUF58 domain-containing protein [Dechloromonas sp. A34]